MSRTPLLRSLIKALALANKAGLTRRDLLRGSAALAATHCARVEPASAKSERAADFRVAIVGGGVAGLTAAYRLQSKGLKPVVFEGADRWGGRILTVRDFYDGMPAEFGGEFVDTRHEDLQALAQELGLALESRYEDAEQRHFDLYFFGGVLRHSADMLSPGQGTGAFIPLAQRIAADKNSLRNDAGAFTDRARVLDTLSLADYLARFRGLTEDWAIDLIAVAYIVEFGLDPAEQSSLNLIDMIAADREAAFEVFGESDEALRIRDGSSRLVEALVSACGKSCDLRRGVELTAIAPRDTGLELRFGSESETFDEVVLAIPFTKLREVTGLDALGLDPMKLRAIRELGYGENMKVVCGTASRVWRTTAAGLPYASNGAFFSDLPFQNVWDSSAARSGTRGLLSNFMAGKSLAANTDEAFEALRTGLSALSPAIGAALDKESAASFAWARHPWSLGSYASAKPGQYTTLLPAAKTPECDGRLHFAGEHTEPDFLGFMNGAVRSGNRVAAEILA